MAEIALSVKCASMQRLVFSSLSVTKAGACTESTLNPLKGIWMCADQVIEMCFDKPKICSCFILNILHECLNETWRLPSLVHGTGYIVLICNFRMTNIPTDSQHWDSSKNIPKDIVKNQVTNKIKLYCRTLCKKCHIECTFEQHKCTKILGTLGLKTSLRFK